VVARAQGSQLVLHLPRVFSAQRTHLDQSLAVSRNNIVASPPADNSDIRRALRRIRQLVDLHDEVS
jgi:hypothetical protein